jgi:hypothetical protein
MPRTTNGIHTITVPAANKQGVRPKVKVGDKVQFSSGDGRFKIEFQSVWPFEKPHSSNGSRFDKSISSRFYKAAQLWKSRRLTLVEGKPAKFSCYIENYSVSGRPPYGGEINPRGK